MSSLYPGGLDSFPTDRTNETVMEDNHPGDHNNLADAVNRIEATLGTDPASVYDTVAERLDATTGVVLVEPTHIAAAQLLNLHTTSIELLPAPGGRLYYVVHNMVFHYRFVTTPYNEELTFQFVVGYGSTVAELTPQGHGLLTATGNAPDLFQHTSDWYAIPMFQDIAASYGFDAVDIENKALSVGIGFGASLTGGDSTLTIRTFYSLIDGAP